MPRVIVILCTCPDEDAAAQLARGLVEANLAACVNILPAVRSIYRWQGLVQDDGEHLMIIKTLDGKYDETEAWLTTHHPYDVPEVVALAADHVSGAYLRWIEDSVNDG